MNAKPLRKKLIEVALPLEAINKASAREKSIRHGHPSTLHLWWARRPLAAARAVIFAQMVDDPSGYLDTLKSDPKLRRQAEGILKARHKRWEEATVLLEMARKAGISAPEPGPEPKLDDILGEIERQRLFRIIEELVQWENTTNEDVLKEAREEIWQSWRRACAENADHPRARELFDRQKLPAFHDPFAGGGALPLEAQRLGLEAYASDLNPVAVLITKAMIEIPPKFAGWPPVNRESRKGQLGTKTWSQKKSSDGAVIARLPEAYCWLIVPEQVTPQAPVIWQTARLTGGDALAVRASKKLRNDELMIATLGSTILRKHLDAVPLWRGDHVSIRQLVEDFARYLYLPRLAGPEVLTRAICDGVALLTWQSDAFAYAESQDETAGRYRGVRAGQMVTLGAEDTGLIVRPDLARRQLEVEAPPPSKIGPTDVPPVPEGEPKPPPAVPKASPRRFHGTAQLDPARVGRDASRIADEVIAHLVGLVGAQVDVTLEIEARLPNGATDQTVRIVTENSRTLKFTSHEFETE